MLPISKEDARNIRLSLLGKMDSNDSYIVKVLLHNNSSVKLNSYGDNPLRLSYHWLDAHGKVLIHDGIRSFFINEIEPSEKRESQIIIHTPPPPTIKMAVLFFV
jgi:hypothetical protein